MEDLKGVQEGPHQGHILGQVKVDRSQLKLLQQGRVCQRCASMCIESPPRIAYNIEFVDIALM